MTLYEHRKLINFVLIQIVLAASLSILVTSGMKFYFDEPRPCEGLEDCPESPSFPSRHAAAAFSIATIFVIWSKNSIYRALSIILAAGIAYWRIFAFYHTLEDVIVGAIVGVALAVVVYYVVKSKKKYKKFYK